MPLSAYRNYIGVAKITTDGYLTASYTSGVTSIVVQTRGTTPTSSMSVIFLDGPNTEKVNISAVTGTNPYTLTVGTTSNPHTENAYVYLQTTGSVGPSNYIPMKTFTVPDKIDQIYDETYRGNMVTKYSVAAAMRSGDWAMGADVFCDTFGFFLKALFGSEDYSSGTPDSHAFGVQNTGSNLLGQYGQPDYYAFYVYNALNTRVVVGKITELGIKFDPKANVSYTAKLLSRASGVVANPTVSFSTIKPIASWEANLTLNSNSYRTPMSAEYTFSRTESEAIPTMQGVQDPYDIFVGAIEAGAKYGFVKEDDTIQALYEGGTLFPVSLALTQGTGATQLGLTVQTTSCNADSEEPKLQGKSYNTEDLAFTCLGNSTDATTAGGGEGNAKVTLLNAVASGTEY